MRIKFQIIVKSTILNKVTKFQDVILLQWSKFMEMGIVPLISMF